MVAELRRTALMLLVLTVITGLVYPGLVTGIAQLMRERADGSLIQRDGKLVGSELIGQPFSRPGYFWSRPSATSPQSYNGMSSSGSNLGPTNPALVGAVKDRIAALRAADPDNKSVIPVDLVTASASGLDPHISPAAAAYQVGRVARERKLDPEKVRALVAQYSDGRTWGILGDSRVNVLRLNLALDALK